MLGAAEAGFFPGIILYLTWWFPEQERTRALALFLTAISAAYVAGGPISGGLLELDGFLGLDGWQWLFLCEGLPAIGLGIFTLQLPRRGPRGRRVARAGGARVPVREIARERELMEDGAGREAASARRSSAARSGCSGSSTSSCWRPASASPSSCPTWCRTAPATATSRWACSPRCRSGSPRWPCSWWPGAPSAPPAASPTSPGSRCVGAARHRPHGARAVAVAAHGRHLARGDRAPRGHPGLLGAAHGVPERRGRRGGHRADRGARQPRRLRRSGVHRDLRGLHGRVRDAADGARRPARGRRRCSSTRHARARPPTPAIAPAPASGAE